MVVIKEPQRGRGRLAELAAQQNLSIIELIKQTVEAAGSIHGAAVRLGVVPNTVRYHLERAGLSVKAQVKVEFEITGDAI